jgi:hypothetical protein
MLLLSLGLLIVHLEPSFVVPLGHFCLVYCVRSASTHHRWKTCDNRSSDAERNTQIIRRSERESLLCYVQWRITMHDTVERAAKRHDK